MMMMETAQREQVQDVLRDVEVINGLMKDNGQGVIRQQEITMNRQIHRQEDKRDAERTKRFVGGRLSRQWLRRLNLDETYRAPSHFTWRC